MNLRELKKQETRQAISDHATRLFIEQGFDKTTIADIAVAARVAKMTVTNYFPRKEDLALDHAERFAAGLAAVVAGRPPGQSVFAALKEAFLRAVDAHDPVAGFAGRPFFRMIADSPTLVARLRDLHEQREAALAAELAKEHDELTARAVAAQLAGAHRVLFAEVQRRVLAGQSESEIADAVRPAAHRVFDLLEPSVGRF
ncbi:TetR/AcrR family transcriptional regulator [Nonomuraea roseoviolacea]|uniref:AcrR family transcriptional regulator n=1 Tax=Nonomuraea roseoviolacea subsp. carminata TaxID=160689 RepID=A0ABT1KCT3_9ACTN|nr:TetR family transcriptional regulator [Nonomuraea roseoviolacea]MCP2351824.1 AcrR family transcriptional regulator [Nonomuraea roseoviolacea subsp. carminata]